MATASTVMKMKMKMKANICLTLKNKGDIVFK